MEEGGGRTRKVPGLCGLISFHFANWHPTSQLKGVRRRQFVQNLWDCRDHSKGPFCPSLGGVMKRILFIFGSGCLLLLMGASWLYWPSLEPRVMPVTLTVAGKTNRPSGSLQVTFRLHNGSRKRIGYFFAKIQYQDQNGHWDDDPPLDNSMRSLEPGASTTLQFYMAPGVKKARGSVICQHQATREGTTASLVRKRFGITYPPVDYQTVHSPEVWRE